MKTLYLMRHAKAGSGAGPRRDHGRALSQRGRETTPLVGAYMAAQGMTPDHILCSDATRTQETLALLIPEIGAESVVEIRPDLYLATTIELTKALHNLPEGARSALLVGHNPGMEDLVLSLVSPTGLQSLAQRRFQFPTAALAAITFDVDSWENINPRAGDLVDFVLPRDLEPPVS
jgi:phosphohistidine phosphatase